MAPTCAGNHFSHWLAPTFAMASDKGRNSYSGINALQYHYPPIFLYISCIGIQMNSTELPVTLFVDGSCPLCAREVRLLKRHALPERLQLIDISAAGFTPEQQGPDLYQLQNCLHARTASGEWHTGIDATLYSWRAAGLGLWVAPLGFRPLRPVWRALYSLFVWLKPHLAWLPHPEGKVRCSKQCMGGEEYSPPPARQPR
jgi:predicted DCC family thiol-disulfide oxidoreductase YuxK